MDYNNIVTNISVVQNDFILIQIKIKQENYFNPIRTLKKKKKNGFG